VLRRLLVVLQPLRLWLQLDVAVRTEAELKISIWFNFLFLGKFFVDLEIKIRGVLELDTFFVLYKLTFMGNHVKALSKNWANKTNKCIILI
jgi:hypothetical protein